MRRDGPQPSPGRDRSQLAVRPRWYVATVLVGAGIVATFAIVLPTVVFASTQSSSVTIPVVGTLTAVVGYIAVARAAGVPFADVYLLRPDRCTVRWVVVGAGISGTVPLGIVLLGDGHFIIGSLASSEIGILLLASVATGIWTGTVEEVFLRGYLLAIIRSWWHRGGAVFVSAGVFGILHHDAATAPAASALIVTVTATAGAFFAVVTLHTGNVWNAVVLHATWNAVFSLFDPMAVASSGSPPPLIGFVPDEEPLILGGDLVAATESPLVLGVFAILLAIQVGRMGHRDGERRRSSTGAPPPPDDAPHTCQQSKHTD